MEPFTYTFVKHAIKLRPYFANKKELQEADVLIFHCPFDCALLDSLDKPSILYEHRAGRPNTFMFDIMLEESCNPLIRYSLRKDRGGVLKLLKQLFQKPNVIIVNSKFIKNKMKEWFAIDCFVVNPPIDLKKFRPIKRKRKYFLSVQRMDWQKRIDVQLKAFEGIKEKLILIGPGNEDLMKKITKDMSNVEYLEEVREKELIELYNGAKAVIQTGYFEDFGLVPIEAMACGIPSIVVDEGGFKETIHSNWLGVRVHNPYEKSLRKTILNFKPENYDRKKIREEAKKYGFGRFRKQLEYYIKLAVKRHENK